MKPFRERNPVVVGFVSLAVLAALMLAAFRADQLPLIGGGTTYYAEFTEASGLTAGDDVRIAGVKVGEVKDITLEGDRVRVAMLLDEGPEFGTQSSASIRIKTLLGAMTVSIEPAGDDEMAGGETIPVARTTPAYDVVTAFSDLATTTEQIDTDKLADAFDTLADVGKGTPKAFRGTLKGLSALSSNVAARDRQLNKLLGNVEDLSGVLANRNEELITLFNDSRTLFDALTARREAIHDILVSTTTLSDELETLVDDTDEDLTPALDDLTGVLGVLRDDRDELDAALERLPAFYRDSAAQTGNGPWLEAWIPNFSPLIVNGEGQL